MTSSVEHGVGEEAETSVVFKTEHDFDDGTKLSTSVLMALESIQGFDMEDSENVLFDYVDLEALDDLFHTANGTSPSGHVTFPAGEYDVTVTASGLITVRE